MSPDRDQLEGELSNHLRDLAPQPAADTLLRATARIAATPQRRPAVARLAGAMASLGWARAGTTLAVAAAALVVGIFIGQAGIPINVGGSPSPASSAVDASASTPPTESRWDEPPEYSFVFTDIGCGGGERDYWGMFRVFVDEGVTLEYVALDETAERFDGDPSDIPTLADLLDKVEEARTMTDPVVLDGRAVFDGSPPEVRLITDPVDGHPLEIFIDWIPEAIDDEECYIISEYAPRP